MMNTSSTQGTYFFHDRDLSWLSFNDRVLREAERESLPLMERIRFLAIYSSNLDEFYRVRIPALMALKGLSRKSKDYGVLLAQVNLKIREQQKHFGGIIENQILPALKANDIHLLYNEVIPEMVAEDIKAYFIHSIATYIQIVNISEGSHFFPENNKLYFVITLNQPGKSNQVYIFNIPSDSLARFTSLSRNGIQYIIFLDDIIRANLSVIFPDYRITSCHSFKITRNAELNLQDEFTGNLAKKIEKKIRQRDFGLATRLLFEPGIPEETLNLLTETFTLKAASIISGGRYHNLKNLFDLPLKDPKFQYEQWPQQHFEITKNSLFEEISAHDILFHTPYHHYNTVVRFFNEASLDVSVKKIYVTLYRIARDSRIANALISAAKNGKKVVVFVELKARFDEANNLKWAKRMKEAGVQIIESIPGLKVHAKIALVKRKKESNTSLLGLLATGNFNETTAQFYTDHILMTAHKSMLEEMERLFISLKRRRKYKAGSKLHFKHLLVGQFNLQSRFLELIDREISNSKKGLPSSITMKLNNLEERVLISKLYEASQAGVSVSLIVRSICCLVPGVKGMSENITVKRIVDRYLEHGRIFIFNNNDDPEIFLGSSDWMDRNVYRRIEVCFPLYNAELKSVILQIVSLQLQDNTQAVTLNHHCDNVYVNPGLENTRIRSQRAIGDLLVPEVLQS